MSAFPFFTKRRVAFIIRNIVIGYHGNAMMRDTAGAIHWRKRRGNGESPGQCGGCAITRYAFLPKPRRG